MVLTAIFESRTGLFGQHVPLREEVEGVEEEKGGEERRGGGGGGGRGGRVAVWKSAVREREDTKARYLGRIREAIPRLLELVHEHAKPSANRHVSAELESALAVRRNTSDLETKLKLGRDIWRARRKAKRQRT